MSSSLWNSVLSPGFTQEEVDMLRLALIKYGCGSWVKIQYHFPFKKCFQLNIQTQRMFGQQSLREFNGLYLDPKTIFQKNSLRTNLPRKGGVIVAKTTIDQRKILREEYQKLEVSEEDRSKISIPIYVGPAPEVGVRNEGWAVCEEIEQMAMLAHKLKLVAYRKEAEEILEKRGGVGNVDEILEKLRIKRVKCYKKQLDEEEIAYQKILERRRTIKTNADIEET